MATIYGLFTDQLCWYIGSTTDVKNRKRAHAGRSDKGCGADLIPREYEWEFRGLEECHIDQRLIRERYWFDILKPLNNKEYPGRSCKEYQETHLEAFREYNRNYYKDNRESRLKIYQKYRETNREVIRERARKAYHCKKATKASQVSVANIEA